MGLFVPLITISRMGRGQGHVTTKEFVNDLVTWVSFWFIWDSLGFIAYVIGIHSGQSWTLSAVLHCTGIALTRI